jgi:hypothetical protein
MITMANTKMSPAAMLIFLLTGGSPMYLQSIDEIRRCTVFVGTRDAQGRPRFGGTAFFVSVPYDRVRSLRTTYLITAKHVAEALSSSRRAAWIIRLNNSKEEGSHIFEIKSDGYTWRYHPEKVNVDVAIANIGFNETIFDYTCVPSERFISSDITNRCGVDVADDVLISGLFSMMSGKSRNLPIVRKGSIAMLPGESVPTAIGDISAYLIEARSTGGLSGSPVFIPKPHGKLGMTVYWLLGIVHGHWDLPSPAIRDAVEDSVFDTGNVNAGIAIVVPASIIEEILNHQTLKDERARVEELLLKQGVP